MVKKAETRVESERAGNQRFCTLFRTRVSALQYINLEFALSLNGFSLNSREIALCVESDNVNVQLDMSDFENFYIL
jgi:hypothetical protein